MFYKKLKSIAEYLTGQLLLTTFLCLVYIQSAHAQLRAASTFLAPVQLAASENVGEHFLAQNPSILPTDATPFQIIRPRNAFGSNTKFRIFKKLPAPLWFTAVTEETGRWETNVFQTPTHGRQDFVFRSLPNVTLGYALGAHTNVYSNYFVIKDIYAVHGTLTFPTTQSLSMGIRRDFPIGTKTVLQLDTQARELWETVHLHQADLLPSLNLTRIINPHIIFFGILLLQMRSRELFQGPTREIDPFYNIGLAMSYNNWNFIITDTYVTNFRNSSAIPPEGNVSMIADFEISHPLSPRLPSLTTFIRAEPIWNWRSNFITGQSGYDFRLYGGLRMTIQKPAYNADIEELRAKLKRQAVLMQELQKKQKQQKDQITPDNDPSINEKSNQPEPAQKQ